MPGGDGLNTLAELCGAHVKNRTLRAFFSKQREKSLGCRCAISALIGRTRLAVLRTQRGDSRWSRQELGVEQHRENQSENRSSEAAPTLLTSSNAADLQGRKTAPCSFLFGSFLTDGLEKRMMASVLSVCCIAGAAAATGFLLRLINGFPT